MLSGKYMLVILATLLALPAGAEQLTIAVASNFLQPARALAEKFEAESGQPVRVTTASTGKLYAQIANGAPFDVLFAADKVRPLLLEESGLGVKGTRFTYAVGRLVLWSGDSAMSGANCEHALASLGKRRLAIANPVTAPYGEAAKEYLQAAGFWQEVQPRLVYGENIAQTLHFVVSGGANFGLIARSQAIDKRLPDATCSQLIPQEMHAPLEQQAILLRRGEKNSTAAEFLAFVAGPVGRQTIEEHGYSVAQ
jgi:molybdate transport system substrate-binding protein